MKNDSFSINSVYTFYFLLIFILPLSFIIRIFFSNTLTSQELGLIYSIISFFSLISFFSIASLNTSMQFYIAKYKNKPTILASLFQYLLLIKILFIVLFSFLVYIFSNTLSSFYFNNSQAETILLVFLFYFIFTMLYNSIKSVFLAFQQSLYFQSARLLEFLSILTFSLLFYFYIGEDLLLFYSIAWVIGTGISFLIYISILIVQFPYLFKPQPFNHSLFKQFLSKGVSMYTSGIGMVIIGKTDIVVITYFLSLSFVAYYSNAIALVLTLAGTIALISKILMPLFSQYHEKKDYLKMNLIVETLYKQILFIITPISVIFILFPEIILTTLFGEEYVRTSNVLIVLGTFLIIRILMQFNISFLNGLNETNYISKIIFPIALFNLFGNIIILNYYDITGIAVITSISWLLITVFSYYKLKKILHLQIKTLFFVKIFSLNMCFVLATLILKNTISIINVYITGILILGTCYFIYILLGYLLKIYTIEELYIFIPNSFKPKVKHYHKTYFNFLK